MVNNIEDYIPAVADDYPDIDPKIIKKVIKLGLQNYQRLIADGMDVKLNSNKHEHARYQLVVVGASPSTQKGVNTRAKRLKAKLEKLRLKWKKQ